MASLRERSGGVQNHTEVPWHLTKSVPIALIITLIVQTVTLIAVGTWYAAKTDSRVEYNTDSIRQINEYMKAMTDFVAKTSVRIDNLDKSERNNQILSERVARLEVVLIRLDKTISRLDSRLETVDERTYQNGSGKH